MVVEYSPLSFVGVNHRYDLIAKNTAAATLQRWYRARRYKCDGGPICTECCTCFVGKEKMARAFIIGKYIHWDEWLKNAASYCLIHYGPSMSPRRIRTAIMGLPVNEIIALGL